MRPHIEVRSDPITQDQRRVVELLRNGKTRIGTLISIFNDFGSHERYEEPRKKTTPRQMFQMIRDLRDAGCPIVGDTKGIYVARTVSEVTNFAESIAEKALSDYQSMTKLKDRMLSIVRV